MAVLIERADAVDYVKTDAKLLIYAGQSEDAITLAIATANGEGLAALRRSGQYDSDDIDALTAATTPVDLKSFVLARFLHHLTKSGEGRPAGIKEAADEAAKTLSFIATGNYIVEGINPAATTTANVKRLYRGDGYRVFDRDNASQAFSDRDEGI